MTSPWSLRPGPGVSERNSLRAKAILSTYATGIQGLVRLLYSVLVGRLGSRELLGQTNSSVSMAVLASQLWAAPAANAGTKYVALKRALEDEQGAAVVAQHLARRTAVVGLILPTTAAVIGGRWLDMSVGQVVATCVLAWVYSLYGTLRGVQYGSQRFRRVAVWDSVAAVSAFTTLGVVLALDARGAILLPLTLGYALFAAVAWPIRVRGSVDRTLRREIDSFIVFGAIGGLASGGLLQASQLAAHHYGGASEAGAYAAALSLATPASMLGIALNTVIVPPLVAAATRGDLAAVTSHTDRITRQLVAGFVGLFGVLVIGSRLGIDVIYGADFEASARLLPILLVAVMLTSVSLSAATALNTTRARGPRLVAILNVAGLVVSLVAWPLLAPRQGTDGVAYGYLLGSLVASAGSLGAVWWLERQRWMGLFLRIFAAVIAMAALAALGSRVDGPAGALVQIGCAVGFAAAWLVLNLGEFRALLRTFRGLPH